jgi:hypothetical protein
MRLAIVKHSKPLTTTKIAKVEDNPNAQIAINQQVVNLRLITSTAHVIGYKLYPALTYKAATK